jgi:hypothetical protein
MRRKRRRLYSAKSRKMRSRTRKQRTYYVSRGGIRL